MMMFLESFCLVFSFVGFALQLVMEPHYYLGFDFLVIFLEPHLQLVLLGFLPFHTEAILMEPLLLALGFLSFHTEVILMVPL